MDCKSVVKVVVGLREKEKAERRYKLLPHSHPCMTDSTAPMALKCLSALYSPKQNKALNIG